MVWQDLPALGSEREGVEHIPMWGVPNVPQVSGGGLKSAQHHCYWDWTVGTQVGSPMLQGELHRVVEYS